MCRSYVLEIENKHKTFPLRFTSSQTVVTEPQISTAPLAPESENEKRNQTSSTSSTPFELVISRVSPLLETLVTSRLVFKNPFLSFKKLKATV